MCPLQNYSFLSDLPSSPVFFHLHKSHYVMLCRRKWTFFGKIKGCEAKNVLPFGVLKQNDSLIASGRPMPLFPEKYV